MTVNEETNTDLYWAIRGGMEAGMIASVRQVLIRRKYLGDYRIFNNPSTHA